MIKPEFGNTDQIRLLDIESKYQGIKSYSYIDCDCGCPNCDAELELCPYCKQSSRDQFYDWICKDCKKEVMPYDVARELSRIKERLNINN